MVKRVLSFVLDIMSYTIEAFRKILSSADLKGFTVPLKGNP
jgi:hypothetical protein